MNTETMISSLWSYQTKSALLWWQKLLLVGAICSLLMVGNARLILAVETGRMGMHILTMEELKPAKQLLDVHPEKQQWHYVTIPFTLDDLKKESEWRAFFHTAKENRVIPLIRLATRFENGSWRVPTRKDIVLQAQFLSRLEWPTEQKHVIVFNEVNHAKEWGGRLDPAEYAEILRFTANWLHTEDKQFVVLPAAMDLAAPNGTATLDAFTYLDGMRPADPTILQTVDYWNSHAYPNPGFSSSPTRIAQNSIRGFHFELEYLKKHTGKDYQTFITETGWVDNSATRRWLDDYYAYALRHVWSDSRVVAVTPFIFKGDPGPFAEFGFVDRADKPTRQYHALQQALRVVQ